MARNTRSKKNGVNSNDRNVIEEQLEDNILDPNSNSSQKQHKDTDSEDDLRQDAVKPKLQIFKGMDDKVSIENWIKRFEMLSKFYKWSESKKIVILGNYLEDDALNWYIENTDNEKWPEIKEKLINRFGVQTVEPIVEFFNLKYDVKTGVKEYFEKKRRFGVLAKLSESQMIPIMIQGLHPKMISNFIAVKPKTFSDFYAIAKTAEDAFKRNHEFINKNLKFKPKTQTYGPNISTKVKRKPPNPCKICENLGFKGRYHWANDCRNKSKSQNTQTKQINVTESVTNTSDESINEINNIDLN